MRRWLVQPAAAVLTAAVLAACSGGQTEAYCSDLEAARAEIDQLEAGDLTSFEQVFDTIRALADEAPDEVSEDWQSLDESLEDFETSLSEAGIEPSDLEKLAQGELPEGIDPQKLETLGESLQSLDSKESDQAEDAIAAHAQEECDLDLSESGSGSG